MPPEQWVAGLITGFVIGIPTGLGMAYVLIPWLAGYWDGSRLRRLLSRRYA